MNSVNLVDMDFHSIKESLKEFMKKQTVFKDYNFEGSGLSALLDVLAYNSQNNAYLANMLANEAEIDSAVVRANVVSRAKLLGYTPRSITAARAVLSVSIFDAARQQDTLVIPRGTRFTVKGDGQQYVFVTLKPHTLKKLGTKFTADDVEVFEGQIKAHTFDVETTERRFVLPSNTIDTSTLLVAVYPNATATTFDVFQRAHGIAKIDKDTPAYWIQETDAGYHELKFGDGVFGKAPAVNSVVYVEYLETQGRAANNLSRFALVGSFAGYENADITIRTVQESNGGAAPETTNQIKLNAPRFFQSNNRAVTKSDFAAVANDVYPYAKSVSVWGGEEVNPPQFGKVFVCIIPQNLIKLTSANKKDIERKIKERAVIGIQPVVVDPKFLRLNMTVTTTLRSTTNVSLGALSSQIRALVEGYFDNGFGTFDTDFHYSELLTLIQNHSRAIAGTRIDYTMNIDFPIREKELVGSYENALVPGSIKSMPVVWKKDGKTYQIIDKPAGSVGVLSINDKTVGKVNYATGEIRLDTSNIGSTELTFTATPANDDLIAGFATAIMLNKNNLTVELKTV